MRRREFDDDAYALDEHNTEPLAFPDELPDVQAEIDEEREAEVSDQAPAVDLFDNIELIEARKYIPVDEHPWVQRKAFSESMHRIAKERERQWLPTKTAADLEFLQNGKDKEAGPIPVHNWDRDDTGYQPSCAQERRYKPRLPASPAANPNCNHDWQRPVDGVAVRQPAARYKWIVDRRNYPDDDKPDLSKPPTYKGTALQTGGARQCEICNAPGYLDLVQKAPTASTEARDHREQPIRVKSQLFRPVDKMTDRDFVVHYKLDDDDCMAIVSDCIYDHIVDESQLDPMDFVKAVTIAVQAIGIPRRHQQYRNGVRNGTVIRHGKPTDKELVAMFGNTSQNARKLFAKSGVHKEELLSLMNEHGHSPDDLYMILNTRFPNIAKTLEAANVPITQPGKTQYMRGPFFKRRRSNK